MANYRKASRQGGDHFDSSSVELLSENNPTWNASALRQGWELLNWRENLHPRSSDSIAGRQRLGHAMSASHHYEMNRGKDKLEQNQIFDIMVKEYHFHPEISSSKVPYRILEFDVDIGLYRLNIPSILKFSSVEPDNDEFSNLEMKLEAETELGTNPKFLSELHIDYILHPQVKDGIPLIFPAPRN